MIKKFYQDLSHSVNQHFSVQPLSHTQPSILQWFDTPLGQDILISEQNALDQIMPEIYGYHLMQLSVLNDIKLSKQSPVTHHFSLGITQGANLPAVASFEDLPIEAESIDAAVLHHVLEYSTNPHQLLRESARTIIPNGYLVVVGFNPVATLALKKQCGRLFTKNPNWRYHSLGHKRVEDWLRLLDFETVFLQFGFYGLPFSHDHHPQADQLFSRVLPFCGAFYVIAARKSVIPMTAIKQPWNKLSAFPNWAKGPAISRKPLVHNDQFSVDSPSQTVQRKPKKD